jgi:hypothetical protein
MGRLFKRLLFCFLLVFGMSKVSAAAFMIGVYIGVLTLSVAGVVFIKQRKLREN